MKEQIIQAYLVRLKRALKNGFDLVPRSINRQFLADFGLNEKTIKQCLLDLELKDYKEGPAKDNDREGELWMFRIKLEGIENIYIKVKIYEVDGVEYLKCISFHN
ncbi:MAG: hypothetical protein QXH07_03175 [Thermoplasmata archaeon]